MSPMRYTALTSVALLAAVLIAPPAAADCYTEHDPAGDMRVQRPPTFEISPAPGRRSLDIRRVTVRHTDRFVSIRVVTRALTRPRGEETFQLLGFVKVNRRARPAVGAAWSYEVEFDQRRPRVGDRLFIVDAEHQEAFGCSGFSDRGLKARANYARHRITMLIPRRCLASVASSPRIRPRWVQVSVETSNSLGLD